MPRMAQPHSVATEEPARPGRSRWLPVVGLALIVTLAAGLRFVELGRLSLWFDEVVSMRLALQPDPIRLVPSLLKTDATRAPLHPLVLQGWLAVFGPSETSGRSLSAVCGVLTVLLIFEIGRQGFDLPTGLWAAWLSAVSPWLVLYSREARMYAWLVLVSCLAWWLLLSFARGAPWWKQGLYVLVLGALAYSHPLGLLMIIALGMAYWSIRPTSCLNARSWLVIHLVLGVMVAPWLTHYLDHPPDISSSQWLAIRYLIGLPIGFVGGNRWALLVCLALIVFGLTCRSGRSDAPQPTFPAARRAVLIWFLVPPLLLYGYSVVSHPIFGQTRYTLFIGPAYLLLLAQGLARLPRAASLPLASVGLILSMALLQSHVYAPDLKADWRAASKAILAEPTERRTVVVFSEDPRWSREVEAARYYLGSTVEVYPAASVSPDVVRRAEEPGQTVWLAVGLRNGRPVARLPRRWIEDQGSITNFYGLRLVRLDGRASSRPIEGD